MTTYESQYKADGVWCSYSTYSNPKRALADKEYLMKLHNITRQKVRVERTIKSVMKKGERK